MSDIKELQDLLYAYVAAEKAIEDAEQTMYDKRAEAVDLLKGIKESHTLAAALRAPGVTCYGKLCVLKGDDLILYPEPTSIFSIKEEVEGNE